jgi:prepilin-type N-terminal cleavage/methylation domain-containing protein
MGTLKKLKGFTIMESLVAMIIVALSFASAGMVYANLLSPGQGAQKQEATLMARKILAETRMQDRFIDERFVAGQLEAVKTVSEYKGAKGIHMVKVEVFDVQHKRLTLNEQLIADEE